MPPLAPSLAVIFAACASPPPPAQLWFFNGTGSSAGTLLLGGVGGIGAAGGAGGGGAGGRLASAQQCLAPLACGVKPGTPLALDGCGSACASWTYDTFTFFTFTSSPSGLLLTSAGSDGSNATVDTGRSTNQQFGYNPTVMTIAPASDDSLCLTAQA